MKKSLKRIAMLTMSIVLSMAILMMGKISARADVSLSGYDFYFKDVRTGQNVRFNANDGKVNLLVYGGVGSCMNTGATVKMLNQLIKGVDNSKLTIYLIDVKNNSDDTMKSFLSSNNVSDQIKVGTLNDAMGGASLKAISTKGRSYYGVGGYTMPLIFYKNTDGCIYDYSTDAASGSDVKAKLESIGLMVNAPMEGTISNYAMNVTYGQTEARSMLGMINSFRTGTEAWCYNSANTKVNCSGLENLSYNFDLEKVAMLRAAEIAYSYSHTRPNGKSCITAYNEVGYSTGAYGENIAYGYTSASSVFEAWKETNEYYDGQGHRRNMLSSKYSTVAIGHVVYNGIHFWVQEFGNNKSNTSSSAVTNGAATVNIKVSSLIEQNKFTSQSAPNASGNACSFWTHTGKDYIVNNYVSLNAYYHKGDAEWVCHDCYATGSESGTSSHEFDNGVVTVPATATADGTMTYTCKTCHYQKNASIPKTGGEIVDPTPSQTPIRPVVTDPTSLSNIRDFASRLYKLVLGREADKAGLDDWTNKLARKEITGAEAARGFFMSDEMSNRGVSNAEYVKICYRTMLNREADTAGLKDWVGKLDNGVSRMRVLAGFTDSVEFGQICTNYGIERGELTSTLGIDRKGAENFVARCYTKALGRNAEPAGLNDWTNKIVNKEWNAEDVATTGFFHSQEFLGKNTSNSEYVKILYRTFLGREADQAGFDDWTGQLNRGVDRDTVLYGFSRSVEFAGIMAQYGL